MYKQNVLSGFFFFLVLFVLNRRHINVSPEEGGEPSRQLWRQRQPAPLQLCSRCPALQSQGWTGTLNHPRVLADWRQEDGGFAAAMHSEGLWYQRRRAGASQVCLGAGQRG